MSTLALLRFTPIPTLTRPLTRPKPPPPARTVSMSSNRSTLVPSVDRLVAAAAYTLPFLNALPYGRFLFSRYPVLSVPVSPFFPLLSALHSVPFAGFVAFFALYLGVVRNPSLPRFVRFNSMQAVVLDVLLALPSLLQRVLGTPTRGVGFRVLELGYDAIFVFAAGCFVYAVVSCVLGRTPYLPIVATAADRQL
ncbi:putative protein TIC 20-v, chloroplastic [Iris pallida]|uniref:Protein TIC 20 n=1 Tax=Iris pallida TaxID=29817 RepID=A0AAX6IJR7_IRIPA|nr:putative protein TIC 20-v, chloroplastic [Iris pallida]